MKIKRLNKVSEAIFDQGNKPLRWSRARKIERRYLKEILTEWQNLERELFEILPAAMPKTFSMPSVHNNLCRCGDCLEPVVKAYSEEDFQDLQSRIAQFLESQVLGRIRGVFMKYLAKFWAGGAVPSWSEGIFNKLLFDALREGGRKAWKDAVRTAQGAGRQYSDIMKAFPEFIELTPVNPLVQTIYKQGFELITAKVTRYFLPELYSVIITGIENRVPWTQIAVNIRRKVGSGAGWHWRRLVRTEMAGAFDKVSTVRYEEFGIGVVKWSIVWPGSCPICREIATRAPEGSAAAGYYFINSAPKIPEDTHPQDRCRKLPVWTLPEGVIPN